MPTGLTPFVILHFLLNSILLLPVSDRRSRQRGLPIITLTLIGINVGIFVVQELVLPARIGQLGTNLLTILLTLIPAGVMTGMTNGALTMMTSAFLHAGLLHLAGNMFFLWFFGRKVEDVLGPLKFLLLYFACVFASGIGTVVGEMALPLTRGAIPNLGASGAIMGVVGAYLFLFNSEQIRTLILPFGWIPIPILPRVPVWFFIFYQIAGDVLNGLLEEQFQKIGETYSLVNSFAHLSGLVGGMIVLYLFLPRELLHYRYRPEQGKIADR